MDKKNKNLHNMNYSNKRDNLRNEIPFQNMVINPNNLFQFGPMPNIVFVDTNFLNKKRGQEEIQSNDNIQSRDNSKLYNKCFRCHKAIPSNEIYKCQTCFKIFHRTCLSEPQYSFHLPNNIIQCSECRIKFASFFAMNYNSFPYAPMQNSPLRIVQAQTLFEPAVQKPYSLLQKKNNSKNNNNKNLSFNKNRNKKEKNEKEEYEIEEEIIDDDEEEEEQNVEELCPPKKKAKPKVVENVPQLINSFYFLNENCKKQNSTNASNEKKTIPKNIQENKGNTNNISIISNNNNNSNIKGKSKPVKKNYSNCFINKNTLQILENLDLTNEEKLIYLLDNFKSLKLNPLIMKVLESRKNDRKNGNEKKNKYDGCQNICFPNDNKENKLLSSNKKTNGIGDNNSNNLNSSSLNNNGYVSPQPIRPSFPMEDKILFKNLEKYKISRDILDRPKPIKIELENHILNKLFIIWDFLITFKDIIFMEKEDDLEIDKNILTFYSTLVDKKNNNKYYKNIFVSLLLLCVKNIPSLVQNPKDQRLFLLKSILDNLHSISFNIISDSPLIVLKEVCESFIYYNSIEENNFKILQNVLVDVNDPKNKELFENNKKVYEKNEDFEDNFYKIDSDMKIYLLHIIIGLCFETYFIKDKLKNEYDSMNKLSYDKKGLDESLFDADKRLKELNRMENFKTLPKEIENLEKKLSELKGAPMEIENNGQKTESKNPTGNNQNADLEMKALSTEKIIEIKMEEKNGSEKEKENSNNINSSNNMSNDEEKKKNEIKEIETQIAKYKSILTENDQLIERKKEIGVQMNEIIDKIYNLKTLRKKYVGIDYQNNEYYYFISAPNRIYIKNKKKNEWGYYENKEDIQKLINKLTEKGKNEKKLKKILKFILAQMKEKEAKQQNNSDKNTEENLISKKDSNKNDILVIENNEYKNEIQNENENINISENEDEINKKESFNKPDDVQINNSINYSEHKISLKAPEKKPNKSKEKLQVNNNNDNNNIHIIEDDDEDEEIDDDKEQEENIQENFIQEKNFSENKIKIINNNINIKKDNINEDNNNDTKNLELNPPKKELFTFVISEDRLPLNVILMKIDEVFSEYLVQFNKQWESEKNRSTWKRVITTNATDKNILTTLKMFNHKFKNPYKILSAEEEKELLLKEKANKGNNFIFDEEDGKEFLIPETNNLLMLSPKVKIWSKEMDFIDIDNYYNNYLLVNVFSREQLCYVVHFYEMAIFGLVHRREGKRKL